MSLSLSLSLALPSPHVAPCLPFPLSPSFTRSLTYTHSLFLSSPLSVFFLCLSLSCPLSLTFSRSLSLSLCSLILPFLLSLLSSYLSFSLSLSSLWLSHCLGRLLPLLLSLLCAWSLMRKRASAAKEKRERKRRGGRDWKRNRRSLPRETQLSSCDGPSCLTRRCQRSSTT